MSKTKKKQFEGFFVDMGYLMNGKKFDSFGDIKKEAYKQLATLRENWVQKILSKHGVIITDKMTTKEKRDVLSAHSAEIVKNEKLNRDMVYKDGKLIGYWSNNIQFEFRSWRMIAKVACKSYE